VARAFRRRKELGRHDGDQWRSSQFTKIAIVSQNSVYPPRCEVYYTAGRLETERVRVGDPRGFCSLASLTFPPAGPPGRPIRIRPGK
jgi:hypothetical protein